MIATISQNYLLVRFDMLCCSKSFMFWQTLQTLGIFAVVNFINN